MSVLEKYSAAKAAERGAYKKWSSAWSAAYRGEDPQASTTTRGHRAAIAALQAAHLRAAAKNDRVAAFDAATEKLNAARAAYNAAIDEIVTACKVLESGVDSWFDFTDTVSVNKWASSGFGSYCGGTSTEVCCGSVTWVDGPAKNDEFGSSWTRTYTLLPGTVMVVRSYGPNGEGPSERWYCNPPLK